MIRLLGMCILSVVVSGAAPSGAARGAEDPVQSRSTAEAKASAKVEGAAAQSAQAPPVSASSKDLRLQDITIEGDVDIPRVLFIESREHLRDHDYLTRLFLESAAQVGARAPVQRILHWSPQGELKPWTP